MCDFPEFPRLPTQSPCQCVLPLLSWPSHRPISGLSGDFPVVIFWSWVVHFHLVGILATCSPPQGVVWHYLGLSPAVSAPWKLFSLHHLLIVFYPYRHRNRLEICPKNYMTGFLDQKFYTLKVRNLRLFLLKKKQRKCINLVAFLLEFD